VKGTLLVTDTDAYPIRLDVTGHSAAAPTVALPATTADLLRPGDAVPEARLIDTNGRAFQFCNLRVWSSRPRSSTHDARCRITAR